MGIYVIIAQPSDSSPRISIRVDAMFNHHPARFIVPEEEENTKIVSRNLFRSLSGGVSDGFTRFN